MYIFAGAMNYKVRTRGATVIFEARLRATEENRHIAFMYKIKERQQCFKLWLFERRNSLVFLEHRVINHTAM